MEQHFVICHFTGQGGGKESQAVLPFSLPLKHILCEATVRKTV